jgi:hypothetical protein
MSEGKPSFSGWAICELMGHRTEPGLVSEEIHFGVPMVRIDSYGIGDEEPFRTRYYGGSSIYCLTPSTEEAARKAAEYLKPRPPTRVALRAPDDDDGYEPERDEDEDADEEPRF